MSDRRQRRGTTRRAVGVMTGTSLDGIDAALVLLDGRGLAMRATLLRHAAEPIGEAAEGLRALASQVPMTAATIARLARAMAASHARAIERLLDPHERPDLIAVHGQTIFHAPPLSWQLVDPAPLARRFACPVVSDLRAADLAAGGQGAPITPIADWVLFRGKRPLAVVNLGGFCNVTVLGGGDNEPTLDGVQAFDVCACNQVLDAVARRALGRPFDEGGRAAASGSADGPAMNALLQRLEAQRLARRSLGTGDEALAWVDEHCPRLAAADLAASAVHAVAECIARSIRAHEAAEIVIAGGGARNAALVSCLASACAVPIVTSDERGVPVEAREAVAMAVLGALCADGVPITLPQVTGCSAPAPVAGSWTGAWPAAGTTRRGAPGRGTALSGSAKSP